MAGAAQIASNEGISLKLAALLALKDTKNFGDNPEDQAQINAGINAFKTGNIDQGFKFLDKTLPLETEISKWLDLAYKPSIFDQVYFGEIFNLENEITKSLYQGLYDSGIYKGFTQSLSDWLVGSSSLLLSGLKDYNFGLSFNTPSALSTTAKPRRPTTPLRLSPRQLGSKDNWQLAIGVRVKLLQKTETGKERCVTSII
jgi:hypothetical protein